MAETSEPSIADLDPEQAVDLSLLVDLEARWENLRKTPLWDPGVGSATHDLHGKQRAYDAFRAKLAAYKRRYMPELLLNTPRRLAVWCRRMRDLYLRVEHDPRAHCPAHLLEKAYRWADRISARMNEGRPSRAAAPDTIRAAIQALEALGLWCDALVRATPQGLPEGLACLGS
jgi:hypothetical protein